MPIMRPNYDKYHRCPAATGPGMSALPDTPTCDGGVLPDTVYYRRFYQFRTNRCPKCDTVVLPYAVRYIDPTNWWSAAQMKARTFGYWVDWQIRSRTGR